MNTKDISTIQPIDPSLRLDQSKILLERAKANSGQTEKSGTAATSLKSPAERANSMEKAAADFETLLMQQMIKSMWTSVGNGGLISGSREEELYRDMLNEEMANEMSKQNGIGLKEALIKDMKNREAK